MRGGELGIGFAEALFLGDAFFQHAAQLGFLLFFAGDIKRNQEEVGLGFGGKGCKGKAQPPGLTLGRV